jgi:hypothetical protein
VLNDLHLGEDQALRRQLRHHQIQLAAIEVWDRSIVAISGYTISFFVLLLVPTFNFPPIKNAPSTLSPTGTMCAQLVTLAELLFIIFSFLIAPLIERTNEYLQVVGSLARSLVLATLLWLILVVFPFPLDLFHATVPILKILGVFIAPFAMVGTIVTVSLRRRRRAVYPDAIVSDQLLRLLAVLSSAGAWKDLSKRNDLLGFLEEAAACIEFGIPRRLNTGDPASSVWLQQRGLHIAAALRGLKQWVAMPKQDTRIMLIDRLKKDLVSVAAGNWDELPVANAKKLSMWVRAGMLVRDLLVALFPLGALLLWRKLNPTIMEVSTFAPLFTAFVLWGVWRLLAIIDPRLSAEVFKPFLELLSSWLRDKS